MRKKSPLEQLQKIRNGRAENLSKLVFEARDLIARLAEERNRLGTESATARARVDQASIGRNLAVGKFVSGAMLQTIVQRQSTLRATETHAQDMDEALREEIAAAEWRADQLADDLTRARKIATRTEVLSDITRAAETRNLRMLSPESP